MSILSSNARIGASQPSASADEEYLIQRSLRFDTGGNAVLTRTPSSAGNRRTWTWSAWVKRNKKSDSWFWGLGHWTRANAEICLLVTKGKPKRISAGVHQIVDDRIMEHSKKPDTVRQRIIELMGDLPRIDLFARETAEGWDSWGNEVS